MTFSHQASVIRHLKLCTGKNRAISVLLVCEFCSKEFKYKSKLDRHLKQCHSQSKKCLSCNLEFTIVYYFKKHIEVCCSIYEQFIPSFTNVIPFIPDTELFVNENTEYSEIHFQTEQFSSTPVRQTINDNIQSTVQNNSYFKENRKVLRKTKHLEEIICNLKSPIKKK